MFDSNVYWSNITLIKLNQCPDYVRLMFCSTLERQSPVEHPTCTLPAYHLQNRKELLHSLF
jgi:hypothetical protein